MYHLFSGKIRQKVFCSTLALCLSRKVKHTKLFTTTSLLLMSLQLSVLSFCPSISRMCNVPPIPPALLAVTSPAHVTFPLYALPHPNEPRATVSVHLGMSRACGVNKVVVTGWWAGVTQQERQMKAQHAPCLPRVLSC